MDMNNEVDTGVYQQMEGIFQALVDAIIPRTPELAELYGSVMYYGALDLLTDQYLIMMLNEYFPSLAEPLSELLTILVNESIELDRRERILYYPGNVRESITAQDWLRVFTLLQHIKDGFSDLSTIYERYPGLFTIAGSLYRFTLMGYYSEWFGYGSTRFLIPDERTFQFRPESWEQVSYPGPALSYIGEIKVFNQSQEDSGIKDK